MNFKSLSNSDLVSKLKQTVSEERKVLTEILHLLREVEVRRTYALYGHSSLFTFTVQELGYDESSAYRRIEAMRLLKNLPIEEAKKVEASLAEGKTNLSNLSSLQSFIKKKESKDKKKLNLEEKKELLEKIENLSTRECQTLIVNLDPTLSPEIKEKERPVANDKTELKIIISKELLKKLKRIQELRAHVNSQMTYAEIIDFVAEIALNKIDPDKKIIKKQEKKTKIETQKDQSDLKTEESLPAQEVTEKTSSQPKFIRKRPPIPAHVRRSVWKREGGTCTYKSPVTGAICGCRFGLEFEHKVPVSQNGTSDEFNLTLHCKTHNLQEAISKLGEEKMNGYLKM